jgi:hypothetical protein
MVRLMQISGLPPPDQSPIGSNWGDPYQQIWDEYQRLSAGFNRLQPPISPDPLREFMTQLADLRQRAEQLEPPERRTQMLGELDSLTYIADRTIRNSLADLTSKLSDQTQSPDRTLEQLVNDLHELAQIHSQWDELVHLLPPEMRESALNDLQRIGHETSVRIHDLVAKQAQPLLDLFRSGSPSLQELSDGLNQLQALRRLTADANLEPASLQANLLQLLDATLTKAPATIYRNVMAQLEAARKDPSPPVERRLELLHQLAQLRQQIAGISVSPEYRDSMFNQLDLVAAHLSGPLLDSILNQFLPEQDIIWSPHSSRAAVLDSLGRLMTLRDSVIAMDLAPPEAKAQRIDQLDYLILAARERIRPSSEA